MLIIRCPWCGPRDEAEFQYGGDAGRERPTEDAPAEAVFDYVYTRDNRLGWHQEWWQHTAGCRQWLRIVRHTGDHRIHAVGRPGDRLEVPES